jgi:ComF family protein
MLPLKIETVKAAFSAAADMLYPPAIYCVSCGNLIDSSRPYALCDRCRHEIDWRFGELPSGHEFAEGFYCAVYAGPVKRMVRDMKYRDKPYIAQYIAEAMADRAAGEPALASADIIVPVPMHAAKKRRRGYNQTELIAARLAKLMGIPCGPDILIKTMPTEAMSAKNRDERRLALSGAFEAVHVPAMKILLIDDVFTTGATADACARALALAGAPATNLFVFATGAMGI